MPTPTIARRYYPRLSEIVTVDDLPEFLSFVQEGLNAIFDKIHYKNLQYSKSYRGDSAFYSLDIVTKKPIGLDLPGGLKLVLNPDATDSSISAFPVAVEYTWGILGFLNSFNLESFSFTPEGFYTMGLQVFRLDEGQVIAQGLNLFTTPASGTVTNFEQLAADINDAYPDAEFELPADPNVGTIVQAIRGNSELPSPAEVLFSLYIATGDQDITIKNLQKFFNIMAPQGIEAYIRDLITPKAKAAFTLSAGLQFPREYLVPVYDEQGNSPLVEQPGEPFAVIPATDDEGNPKVTLRFGEAVFYADTEKGLGYSLVFNITMNTYAQIGNTGMIVYLNNLKIDLSKDSNIPEADQDGRPPEFIGVYAEQLDVIMPKKWFSSIQEDTTLQIAAKKLLIGTGGLSGTIALETIETGNPPAQDDYLWFRIGGDNGFKVGFSRFDITFKQNKVISSGIAGALEIKKFKYPEGHPQQEQTVRIGIAGHIGEDGGFELTATVQEFPIRLPGVFTYHLKTVVLGRDTDDSSFYIGTSGTLEFDGFLRETLNLGPIEIQSLRIYSDGSMEFEGGSISLLEPIVLPLGPVDITVSAIHYGSMQKQVNGTMRKFSYFGFDGGLKVDPLGVEIRGDGVKYYFCTDDLPNPPEAYLHIETVHLDLTIPAKNSVAIINGSLTIPDPGVSPEYSGELSLQLPKLGVTGSVGMKLMPRYPAFLLDAALDFQTPIAIGTFAVYGFRGLLGYRYVAEKEAIGLTSSNSWYEYYKKPQRGINVFKFSGPNQTSAYSEPYSIGAGASLGTSFDNGTILNLKVMLLLSTPSVFMLDGRAAILSARLGLESTKEPPFFAMAAIGPDSIELGFGADFRMPTKSGNMLKLYAEIQAAFFFNNSSKWYINFGTKQRPVTARILSLVDLKSYLMLSSKGIEAGARGDFDFKRKYAGIIKVHAWAYIEIGGKLSFERPQYGAYLDAGVGAKINVKFVKLRASFDILFAVEASEPFLIYGRVRLRISINILWVFTFRFRKEVEVLWEKNKYVNKTPVNPLITASKADAIPTLVKGVNMLSNEVFELAYLGGEIADNVFKPDVLNRIIPLDTYIDIKTEKGLLPSAIGNLIGGVTNAPVKYTDLIPPDAVVKGKVMRQVKHQYSVTELSIKFWLASQGDSNVGQWKEYHPYKALYPVPDPNNPAQTAAYDSLKIGQFQKTDGQYNTIRLLSTTPFSYTEQGQPGWYIPEQYGITPSELFCESESLEPVCANFLTRDLGHNYYCNDVSNDMFFSNDAAFCLIEEGSASVTDHTNVFQFARSLAFDTDNELQIVLPSPSVYVKLKLTSDGQGVRIRYYSVAIDELALEVPYGNPDPLADDQNSSYDVLVSASDLHQPVEYNRPDWRPVTKIIIEPIISNPQLRMALATQLSEVEDTNELIANGLAQWEYESPVPIRKTLDYLNDFGGTIRSHTYLFNIANNQYADKAIMQWKDSWDIVSDHKLAENKIGFHNTGNTIKLESDYQLIGIKLQPWNQLQPDIRNNGLGGHIKVEDIADYVNPDGNVEIDIDFYENCIEDVVLCNLYNQLSAVKNTLIAPGLVVDNKDLEKAKNDVELFVSILLGYDAKYPDYDLSKLFFNQLGVIDTFLQNLDINTYQQGYDAATTILEALAQQGNCNCDAGCTKDELLCGLSNDLNQILQNCLIDPKDVVEHDLPGIGICITEFLDSIEKFVYDNPQYPLGQTYFTQIAQVQKFFDGENILSYTNSYTYILEIVEGIETEGNCSCECDKNVNLCALYTEIHAILQTCLIEPQNVSENDIPALITCVEDFLLKIEAYNTDYPDQLPTDYITLLKEIAKFRDDPGLATYETSYGYIVYIVNDVEVSGNCNCGNDCDKDEDLCKLYMDINQALQTCLKKPEDVTEDNLPELLTCAGGLLDIFDQFNTDFPNYSILEAYHVEIDAINDFIKDPALVRYEQLYLAVGQMATAIEVRGNCECGGEDAHNALEDLYEAIDTILDEHFQDVEGLVDFTEQIEYVNVIIDLVTDLNNQYPELGLLGDLENYIDILEQFLENPGQQTLQDAIEAIEAILDHINELGNFEFDVLPGKTLFHEICWLSLEAYEYNQNIPGQAAISADAQATIAGLTQYIQPVWRPDTSYKIQFTLRDTVTFGNTANTHDFKFSYGFTTAGPVGYFHTDPASTYGDMPVKKDEKIGDYLVPEPSILDDVNGILRSAANGSVINDSLNPHPERYPLTSLRRYIDYNRSYPYADGNLLSAKPLFYNAGLLTRIDLYYAKAYATHFFKNWQPYNGLGSIDGRMKIVIKDPAEADDIINPPYLDYDPEDVETIHIPQTIEEWTEDNYPLMPFVLSQWANLYNSQGHCILHEGNLIRPASEYTIIALKNLKPSKLYTAVVNNLYDLDGDAEFDTDNETQMVHSFGFRTSCYADFTEQVNSYKMHLGQGDDYAERKAIFTIDKAFTNQQIMQAYQTMMEIANDADALIPNYQHVYDRVFEGIFGINAMHDVTCTEFNIVRNLADNNKAIAIIIRNPEPFNIPRIPAEFLADTIQVLNGGVAAQGYKVIHSKDYSQAMIMHESLSIDAETLDIKFRFKMWNGTMYTEAANVPPVTIELI